MAHYHSRSQANEPFSSASSALFTCQAGHACHGASGKRRQWGNRCSFTGLFFLLFLLLGACRSDESAKAPDRRENASKCVRKPWSSFVVGANVIDLPDHLDDDKNNDGLRGYGSDAARRTLRYLRDLGLDGVALPFPIYASHGTATEVRAGHLSGQPGLQRLIRMVEDAHGMGFGVMWVPHLALDDGSWRGDLFPQEPGLSETEAVRRFWTHYRHVILPMAEYAEALCVEAFSIGVELKSLTRSPSSDAPLDALVAELRSVFSGELLYNANWDEVEQVRGWQRFDRIGVQAFAPLADADFAEDDTLRAGALRFQRTLGELKTRVQRPLWFTESGFKAIAHSYVEPWKWPTEVRAAALPVDEKEQKRAYAALSDAFRRSPTTDGVFFWAVPSDLADAEHPWAFEPKQGFSFVGKEAQSIVQQLAHDRPVRGQVVPEGSAQPASATE